MQVKQIDNKTCIMIFAYLKLSPVKPCIPIVQQSITRARVLLSPLHIPLVKEKHTHYLLNFFYKAYHLSVQLKL